MLCPTFFYHRPAAMSLNRIRHCPTIVGKAKRCDNRSAQSPIFRRKDSLAINSVRASAIFFSSPTGLTRIPLSWSLMISEGPLSQLNATWGTAQTEASHSTKPKPSYLDDSTIMEWRANSSDMSLDLPRKKTLSPSDNSSICRCNDWRESPSP